MLRSLAVIIPTRNEEDCIHAAIRSSFEAGAGEVIVSDGGSTDGTVAAAIQAGAQVVNGSGSRGEQLNRGASAASADALLFLHADSRLPESAAEFVLAALNDGYVFGGFRLAFIERQYRLRLAAAMINLRTRLTRCPWGDQGQFLSREQFLATGGFLPIPIMEDYELAQRMKRTGTTTVIEAVLKTSARRFLRKGIFRTAALNWYIIVLYRLGRSPDALARIYRG